VPNKPSILHQDGLVFMIDDSGIATCLEAATGQTVWNERVGGNYSASPILSDGRIFFCSEEGKVAVVEAARQFRVISQNQLEDGIMASPAARANALILRGKTHLYRIETKPQ
jgi:outer membrane protein assembly factor BamB